MLWRAAISLSCSFKNAYMLYALNSPEITFSVTTHYSFMLCYSLKILAQIYMILISVLL
jgi:hypothetical protein